LGRDYDDGRRISTDNRDDLIPFHFQPRVEPDNDIVRENTLRVL
jgi:hypothetical protein